MDTFRIHQSLPSFLLVSLFFFLILSSSSAQDDCSPIPLDCGGGKFPLNISYPFWAKGRPEYCCHPGEEFKILCNETDKSAEIEIQSRKYHVREIHYSRQTIILVDKDFFGYDNSNSCVRPSSNISLDLNFFQLPKEHLNLTFVYNCSSLDKNLPYFKSLNCPSNFTPPSDDFFSIEPLTYIEEHFRGCPIIEIPILKNWGWLFENPDPEAVSLNNALTEGFEVSWSAIDPQHDCWSCVESAHGHCGYNKTSSQPLTCYCNGSYGTRLPHFATCPPAHPPAQGHHKKEKKYIIGVAVGGGAFLCLIACILLWCFRKKLYSLTSSKMLSRAISSNPSLKSDLEKSNSLCATQFFDYKDLAEATNNFDPSKELGDGGFGIVYQGKLRDGRNVAVKRLYENNCRCVEQFKNEINILSYLRHQNLVTLYGCSSRHSRELLLVYEFIPNGTVADHLHGDRAKPGALTWPTRMSIAIETADALKYLHAVEIVHRDVKTNNILLDNNFHVKVADFGLSRLFPTDVTHVSTAPQGTPGYVDPDYHRCYQLTNKSDVYSFGVVLIELISSKPAVDITRHRHEINLANMAINKIINSALHELVDPNLGFESDLQVRRMITSVAGLAFRCLQDDKDSRPPMEEVLECLRGIENEEYNVEKVEEVNTPADDEVLLKKMPPLSPIAVTDAWESRTTTPNTSG